MKSQIKTQIQAGLDLIHMGNRMIAGAEISPNDVAEAFDRARNGDPSLLRQLSQKVGFIDLVMVVYP